MRAKEYYAKYGDALKNPKTADDTAFTILKEFATETAELLKVRHIKTDAAAESLLEEMNIKWNALARMLNPPVLKENGFKKAMLSEINGGKK